MCRQENTVRHFHFELALLSKILIFLKKVTFKSLFFFSYLVMYGFWIPLTGFGRRSKSRTVIGKHRSYGAIQQFVLMTQLSCLVNLVIKDILYPQKK